MYCYDRTAIVPVPQIGNCYFTQLVGKKIQIYSESAPDGEINFSYGRTKCGKLII